MIPILVLVDASASHFAERFWEDPTPHWPLQLPDDWLDRNAGRYDDCYDVLRVKRHARASELVSEWKTHWR